MLQSVPLLAFSLLLYSMLSLFGGGAGLPWHALRAFSLPLISGELWQISYGDLFLTLSMGLLFVEILRATQIGSASVTNHAFSVLVFILSLLAFITTKGYGNSVFFLFTSMTLLDFMAGFIITTVASRRDLALSRPEL